jgi:hypothetical protein
MDIKGIKPAIPCEPCLNTAREKYFRVKKNNKGQCPKNGSKCFILGVRIKK